MKKKLSLTNVAKNELKKSEMKKTLAGVTECDAHCTCVCGNGGFVAAITDAIYGYVAGFNSLIEQQP